MDQFCAAASDTYRRCICSEKFRDFGDMDAALDQARDMLQSFVDNNLANVGLSADEVGAMNSATAGELAATTDTSAAASMLNEIGDLLSGRKKPAAATSNVSTLDFSNLNFDAALDDIWSGTGTGTTGLFGNTGRDLSALDGVQLYNEVNNQCGQMAESSCDNVATLQMVRSAYGLLINQDCTTYEKSLDNKKEQVSQKVREANNILRDARLEEYRSHNSASMNECITAVRGDILNDAACGAGYKRCLDFTGLYISQATGEPIYSPSLFQLSSQIRLENPNAAENNSFLAGLDSYRNRATASLNTCRDDADAVWDAFKRQALIEISQAQDRKLQEVKDSCVMTMKDCYDTTTDALNSFDDATSRRAGALSARAASVMCADQVSACAALYTPAGGVICQFDANNRITNAAQCGLQELLNFVSAVDSARIAEGCDAALESYVADNCTPVSGDAETSAPYGCRLSTPETLEASLRNYALTFCDGATGANATLSTESESAVARIMVNVRQNMAVQLQSVCAESNGLWVSRISDLNGVDSTEIDANFATRVFGGLRTFDINSCKTSTSSGLVVKAPVATVTNYAGNPEANFSLDEGRSAVSVRARATSPGISSSSISLYEEDTSAANKCMGWGLCLTNSGAVQCLQLDTLTGGAGYARWQNGACMLSQEWYQYRCEISLNGYWESGTCYV
jgi:hypothetical protein